MAIYTNLPVFEDTYKLYLSFVNLSRLFQRDFRYTLGEQVQRALMDIMVDIFRANKNHDKADDIAHARERLMEAQVVMRVLNETKQMSVKQFAMMIEMSTKVSKQLANWERASRK